MKKEEILKLSLIDVRDKIAKGELSSEGVVRACLDRIHEKRDLNAVLSLNENAIEEARAIDERIARGDKSGLLAGVPILVKVNLSTQDNMPTSCASKYLENYCAPFNATVIEKLKAEGAIIIGKTNMDEFALGGSNENSAFGRVLNPVDHSRVSGGSSGGNAASVAAELVFGALGSDTGGSIRQPAAFCGIVGMKPTYGRVSRFGAVAFGSSLDQIGPMTRTVKDAALMLDIIAGADEKDSTSVKADRKLFRNSFKESIAGMKIGVAKEYFNLPMDDEIRKAGDRLIAFYKKQGAKIVDVSLPNVDKALACYYIISSAEVASNLGRFDGIRFGERAQTEGLNDMYVKSRSKYFGAEVKRRIILGNYVLSSGFYDAYYNKANKVRQVICNEFAKAFEKCDAILAPVAPGVAWKAGEKTTPLSVYMADVFTVPVSMAKLPAISFPVGTCPLTKMPIGYQLIGKEFNEDVLFALAEFYERLKG